MNEWLHFFSNCSLAQGALGRRFRKSCGVETVRFLWKFFRCLSSFCTQTVEQKGEVGELVLAPPTSAVEVVPISLFVICFPLQSALFFKKKNAL